MGTCEHKRYPQEVKSKSTNSIFISVRNNQVHNRKYLSETRKALRKKMTMAESVLWEALKNGQLGGKKFRRQHSIESYIADFYCASEKLVIELDGEIHNNTAQSTYDNMRNERMKELGYKVLRFENARVFKQLATVLVEIKKCFSV